MPTSSFAESQNIKLIPLEVLFGNPMKAAPQISPDGKHLSYIAPANNVLNVWVKTVGKNDDRLITHDKDRGVRQYFWSQDNRHILYLQDKAGNENWRLYSVDLETEKVTDLTPFEGVQARVLATDKHYPTEILILMNKENKSLHDVYHLDLISSEIRLVAKNPGNVSDWGTDANFKVLLATASRPDGGTDLLLRKDERSDWHTKLTWSLDDNTASGPLSFSKDGRFLYMKDSRNYNTGRLVKMELATDRIEIIAEDPEYDLSGVMFHPDTYELQMISFLRDKTEYRVIDGSIEPDIQKIKNFRPGDFFIAARDNADLLWIIGYRSDRTPLAYYLFDRKTGEMTFLFENNPKLNEYALASMEPISFKSRDGLVIHGYITFPQGLKRLGLPMVLNVHGGPWSRDAWGYDGEAQWLANRGYVCMQVNFRASTGYGKDFLNAGNKEWGGKCQNDLTDAVKWAIDKNYADPKRIAIFGGSYGGYAALAGAAFTPDLYACAVDVVGPSNLISFIKSIPPYWSVYLEEFRRRVGDPDSEEEFLKSRSPFFHVDRIKIPMLIAQGANDPRVNRAESEQIVRVMKEKGIDHEYMLFPDEGHGFAKPANRLKFYKVCEKFLAKHLGGRLEDQ